MVDKLIKKGMVNKKLVSDTENEVSKLGMLLKEAIEQLTKMVRSNSLFLHFSKLVPILT